MTPRAEPFGPVIYAYTRRQALEDGVLRQVPTDLATEAGFRVPVAMTAAAWLRCVTVPLGCKGMQDETGRLWDVLWMLRCGIKRQVGSPPNPIMFSLHVVGRARDLRGTPPLVELKATSGPGDDGEPVITIMLPEED